MSRPVFGVDRDPGVAERGDRVRNGKGRWGAYKVNPLLSVFGPGPEGARCRDCVHLFARRLAGTYYKCDLRPDSGGPLTDHRVRWPACGRFERRKDDDDADEVAGTTGVPARQAPGDRQAVRG